MNTEKEKANLMTIEMDYIIRKSMLKMEDLHPKKEVGQRQNLCICIRC